jgi:hypothetical protein
VRNCERNEVKSFFFPCFQGTLYITYKYYGFYSNLFGHETIVYGKFSDIYSIKKENIALIFPTAIRFYTKTNGSILFASFILRNSTYEFIRRIWSIQSKTTVKSNRVSIDNTSISTNNSSVTGNSSMPLELDKKQNANKRRTPAASKKPRDYANGSLADFAGENFSLNNDNVRNMSLVLKFKFLIFSMTKYLVGILPVYTSECVQQINYFFMIVIFFTIILMSYLYFFIILTQLDNIENNLKNLHQNLNQ